MSSTIPDQRTPDPDLAIRLDELGKDYESARGIVRAVESITLEVPRGSFISLVGESGCGKSTVLKLIAGLIEPTRGSIELGQDNARAVDPDVADLGMVFQVPALLGWRDVLGNVLLPLEILQQDLRSGEQRARELIELVGLGGFEHRYPRELSGGMQQRVSIARALVSDPGLLLMDEPFGALDALTRHDLRFELLRIWRDTGKTIIFVTHDIEEAVLLSDEIAVLMPRPSKIFKRVSVPLERPRDEKYRLHPDFGNLVEAIHDDIQVARQQRATRTEHPSEKS